jgi:FkbH-like protein
MDLFVFRNYTLEPIFAEFDKIEFSGYGLIAEIDNRASIYIWFYLLPVNQDITLIKSELDSYLEKLDLVIQSISPDKTIIALTIEELFSFQAVNSNFEIKTSVYMYNIALLERAKIYSNLKVLDFFNFLHDFNSVQLIDWKYFYLSDIIINPKLAHFFYIWLNSKINSINNIRKKCLILDLDNTIWGGVIGEDGINGIKLGGGYPGNAFKTFQKDIFSASQNGVMLAICSKNNYNDVLELIENHPEEILKLNNFLAIRINWEEKSKNIISIAEELNIGTNSMVFIDDNPVERELIKSILPEVAVPDFPKSPYELKKYFRFIYEAYFQIYALTEEDKNKSFQYKSNVQRELLKKKVNSVEDYLKSLETQIIIYKANDFNIVRISQMSQKTNQFNLTNFRYTEGDIREFINSGYLILCAAVQDKFGDNGITAVSIIKIDKLNKTAYIDSFLLSCRILGRKIENCFLSYILNTLYDNGIKKVEARYLKTLKNTQVEDFYDKNGFTRISETSTESNYSVELENKFIHNDYIKLIENYD